MSGKNQNPYTFNWQSADPRTNFLPLPANQSGSVPSGVVNGTMSDSATIYTNIIEVSRMDNQGIEVAWTGTPTGTISVLGSNSGINWFSFTFSPTLVQPAGSAAVDGLNLNQYPFKYIMMKYVNSSGSGTIAAYGQQKDLN